MSAGKKNDLCLAFAEAVALDDEDAMETGIEDLGDLYGPMSEAELYEDLLDSFDTLYPQPGRNTDKEVATEGKSDEIPDKYAHLLGSMIEMLPTRQMPDIVLERCAEIVGLNQEENPNKIVEAIFAVMAAHIRSQSTQPPAPGIKLH